MRVIGRRFSLTIKVAIITLAALAVNAGFSQEKTITTAIIADPGTMNPITASSTAEVHLTWILFDGLTILDPQTFEPRPHVAKSWDTSSDGLTWTFHLRDDVYWHDGVKLTAADVKFTFDKMLDPSIASANGANFRLVKSVNVVDDYTVQIVLSNPWAALPTFLATRFLVAPKHLLEGKDIAHDTAFNKTMPIGTGPFKMVKNDVGNYIELAANPNYFGGTPKVDRVFLKILPDANAQIAQLRTGELDFIALEAPQIPALKNVPHIRIKSGTKSRWYAFHVNDTDPLFLDVRVRQAISYAIDRQLIIDTVLLGYGKPATGPIIPALKPYYTSDVKTYPYDPAKARALLKEAGWTDTNGDGILDKDGKPFRFEMSVIQGNSLIEQATAIIQQNLKAIGLDPYQKGYEFSSFISQVRDNRQGPTAFQSYFVWMTPEPEPDGIYAYFHSSNAITGSNFTVYRNPKVDELLDRGRQSTSRDERIQIYQEIQRILAEEVPRIFIAYPEELYAIRDNVSGIEVSDPWSYSREWAKSN